MTGINPLATLLAAINSAGQEASTTRERAERFCADQTISTTRKATFAGHKIAASILRDRIAEAFGIGYVPDAHEKPTEAANAIDDLSREIGNTLADIAESLRTMAEQDTDRHAAHAAATAQSGF